MLKDRASHRRNLIQANIASVDRTPFDAMVLLLLLALFAVRHTAGKALFFQVLKAGFVIWELAVKIRDRVPQMGWNGLTAVHNAKNFIKSLT